MFSRGGGSPPSQRLRRLRRLLDLRAGTLSPFLRASDSPIAIACLLLVTSTPLPLCNVPFFRLCMARFTDSWTFSPYRAMSAPPFPEMNSRHCTSPNSGLPVSLTRYRMNPSRVTITYERPQFTSVDAISILLAPPFPDTPPRNDDTPSHRVHTAREMRQVDRTLGHTYRRGPHKDHKSAPNDPVDGLSIEPTMHRPRRISGINECTGPSAPSGAHQSSHCCTSCRFLNMPNRRRYSW